MRLVVTGATGYIGTRLVSMALKHGHEIIALARRPPAILEVRWVPFDLYSDTQTDLPAGVLAVIHLAATTHRAAVDVDGEVFAARRLIAASKRVGARFVFVSSQTAREDAPSAYGRAKWLIELETVAAGGLVIRPGQVYGGHERALFGVLVRAVRALPFIPVFLPAPKIQPIHVDDLAAALLAGVERSSLFPRVLCVGSPKPITFTYFLRTIARERVGRVRPLFPVPGLLVRVAGKLMGPVLTSALRLDRLISLLDLPSMNTDGDLRKLGVTLRPLSAGMARSGNGQRRALIREGRALLAYTLRRQPAFILIRRYVRGVEQIRGSGALDLPWLALRAPTMLALLDDRSLSSAPMGAELIWRMNAAVVVGEASVQGARRCLRLGEPAGYLADALRIGRAIALEVAWRFLRCCLSPIIRPALREAGLCK